MRIKQEDLAGFIAETLLSIKAGVEAARDQGLVAELPEKVEFSGIEVIRSGGEGTLSNITTSSSTGTTNSAATKPTIVETTSKTGGGTTTIETGTDSSTKVAALTRADDKTTTGKDDATTTGSNSSTADATNNSTKAGTSSERTEAASQQSQTQSSITAEDGITTKAYL